MPFPRPAYRPLVPYAPDRRPAPVDLSDNTNRWGPHPAALDALRESGAEALLRYPSVYADELREALAKRFDVPAACVVTGCGSDDLLDSAFRAACDPGRGVRFLSPTFSMVDAFARMNGLRPLPLGRGAPPGGRAPADPLPEPEELLADAPGILYLCRPNNPTGEILPRAWVQTLVEAADALDDGPIVLVDEAYLDFAGEPGFLALAPDTARLVVLRTLSKAYGLAGLRVGFAVGPPEVIREIRKSRGPYKVSRPAEAAATAALGTDDGWVDGVVSGVRLGRDRLERALRERGFDPLPSGGNFVCLPLEDPAAGEGVRRGGAAGPDAGRSAREGGRARRDATELAAGLRRGGVAVRAFPDLEGVGDAIRITIGPPGEIDAFLATLDEVLR